MKDILEKNVTRVGRSRNDIGKYNKSKNFSGRITLNEMSLMLITGALERSINANTIARKIKKQFEMTGSRFMQPYTCWLREVAENMIDLVEKDLNYENLDYRFRSLSLLKTSLRKHLCKFDISQGLTQEFLNELRVISETEVSVTLQKFREEYQLISLQWGAIDSLPTDHPKYGENDTDTQKITDYFKPLKHKSSENDDDDIELLTDTENTRPIVRISQNVNLDLGSQNINLNINQTVSTTKKKKKNVIKKNYQMMINVLNAIFCLLSI